MVIRELNRLQEEHGYLRPADLKELSERLRVPLYRLQGLATFYPHFRTTPPPPAIVTLCRVEITRARRDTPCSPLFAVSARWPSIRSFPS